MRGEKQYRSTMQASLNGVKNHMPGILQTSASTILLTKLTEAIPGPRSTLRGITGEG